MNSLRDEIDSRSKDFEKRKAELTRQFKLANDKHRERELLTRQLNEEYFRQRQHHDHEIRKLQEEKTLLKLKQTSLGKQLENTEQDKFLENAITKDLKEKRAKEYAQQFKTKATRKEETHEIVKEQFVKVKEIYSEKTKMLENDLALLKREIERLKSSKSAEIELAKGALLTTKREMKLLLKEQEARRYPDRAINLNQAGNSDTEDNLEDDTVDVDDLNRLMKKMQKINKKLEK